MKLYKYPALAWLYRNVWERALQSIKLKVALFIDRDENVCWADLATWAMGIKDWREIKTDGECRKGGIYWYNDCGGCYCGKHRIEDNESER